MTTATESRPFAQSDDAYSVAGTLAIATVSIFALSTSKRLLEKYIAYFDDGSAIALAVPLVVVLAAGLALVRVRYDEFAPILRFSIRSSAAGLFVLLLLEPVDFTLVNEASENAFYYVEAGYFVSIAIALASLFRPSLVPAVGVYVMTERLLAEPISTLPLGMLDIRYMIDMAIYLSVMGIASIRLARFLPSYFQQPVRQEELACIGFGLHLGNYFWSAVAKAALAPYPWTWALENLTYNGTLFSIQNGTSPIGHLPWLVNVVYETQILTNTPLNVVIILFQLGAIICVLKPVWLKAATLFYDLFHVGIWVLGGLFFWPWVWNNFTVLLALRKQALPLSPGSKAACMLVIVLGNPAWPFQESAWLGWYDVADARQIYFEAITPNGNIKVPSSFFLSHSYAVSHGYMDVVEHPGQFAHLTWWASTTDYERKLSSGTCPDPVKELASGEGETELARQNRLEKVRSLVQAHHAKMLRRQDSLGKGSYYWRIHHHLSNPFLYSQFNSLDLHEVAGYNLVVESVCHTLDQGRVRPKIVGRLVEHFGV